MSVFFLSIWVSNASGRDLFICGHEAPHNQNRAKMAGVDKLPSKGYIKALTVFVKFPGEFPDITSPLSYSADIFNIDLPGSFSHFYDEMSCGQLKVEGEILPKLYVADHPPSYYIDRCKNKETIYRPYGQVVRETLGKADSDIDFRDFDNDGPDGAPNSGDDDGFVDVLFVNFLRMPSCFIMGGDVLGIAELGVGRRGFTSSDAAISGGKIRVNLGSVQETRDYRRAVGAMCHEFGHLLGLGDLYNKGEKDPPEKDFAGIGSWGLMGHGTWGWNGNDGPNPFCAYSLERLGWIGVDNGRLEVVTQSQTISVSPLFQGGKVYKIPLSDIEYYLISNRDASASYYDRNIPGNGLMIWHVTGADHASWSVDLECADGRYSDAGYPLGSEPDPANGEDNLDFWASDEGYRTSHGGNLGDATDPFDGEIFTSFSEDTNPSSMWEGYGFPHDTDWYFAASNVAINEIHREAGSISAFVDLPQGLELFDYIFEKYTGWTDLPWVSVENWGAIPGDLMRLRFRVKNWTDVTLASPSVTVSSDDPFIGNPEDSFQPISLALGEVLPGEVTDASSIDWTLTEFEIAPDTPQGHEIVLKFSRNSADFQSRDSVAIRIEGEWLICSASNSGLPNDFVSDIAIDSKGNKWIATQPSWDGGLAKFDGENWETYSPQNSGMPSWGANALAIDEEDNIWIGTEVGLVKFDGVDWVVYNTSNSGMPYSSIYPLAIDSEGNIWFGPGAGKGLVKFDGINWTVYSAGNSGLPHREIWAIDFDREGNVWIASHGWGRDGGLVRFDGENWEVYNPFNSPLRNLWIWQVVVDPQDNIWIGHDHGGLTKFDGENWTVYDISNSELPGTFVRSLHADEKGNIWAGGEGLAKFDGESWEVYGPPELPMPPNRVVITIETDTQDNIWIGTNFGLIVYHKGGIVFRPTAVEGEIAEVLPSAFALSQNYPNPFNATTQMSFSIPNPAHIKISIYNILGQTVRELTNREYIPGIYHVKWDGMNDSGTPVASGIYFYRMTTVDGSRAIAKRMVLLR